MADQDRLRQAFKNAWHKIEQQQWIHGKLGRPNTDGTYTFDVPGRRNYVYVVVRNSAGGQTVVPARNDAGVEHAPLLSVRMKQEYGVYVIYGKSGRVDEGQNPTNNPYGLVNHAASHEHGGGDEVGSEIPIANGIVKADVTGKIATGWIAIEDVLGNIVEGTGVDIDITDPDNPVISADVSESIEAAAEKTSVVDADKFGINDSADTNLFKRITWANIKATLVATFLTFTNKIAIAATATSGAALAVTRNLAAANTDAPVVTITQDEATDDQEALNVLQDGSAAGVKVERTAIGMLVEVSDDTLTETGTTFGTGFYQPTAGSAGLLSLFRALTTSAIFQAGVVGETFRRFFIFADGQIAWGGGSGVRDTNLYRNAANVLKTDDNFHLFNILRLNPSANNVQIETDGTDARMDFITTRTTSTFKAFSWKDGVGTEHLVIFQNSDVEIGRHLLLKNNMQLQAYDVGGTLRTLIMLTSSDEMQLWNNSGGNGGPIIFRNESGGAESARIDGSGNLGLGVTTVEAPLHVTGVSGNNGILTENAIYFGSKTTGTVLKRLLGISASNIVYIGDIDNVGGGLRIRSNGVDAIIAVGANNGFGGVTNPGAPIHVDGHIRMELDGFIQVEDSGGTARSIFGTESVDDTVSLFNNLNGDGGAIRFRSKSGGGEAARFDANGILMIGLTSVGASILGIKAGSSSNDAAVGGVLYTNTTTVGNVGTGEDDLMFYSIPADTLAANGQSVWFEAIGYLPSVAVFRDIRLRFGGTLIFGRNLDGTEKYWTVKGRIIRNGATSQRVEAVFEANDGAGGTLATHKYVTTTAITLSSSAILKMTGQGTNNNDVQQNTFIVGWDDDNS